MLALVVGFRIKPAFIAAFEREIIESKRVRKLVRAAP